jgi:hypothetical protein
MECRAVVQTNPFAQFGEADPVPVTSDLFEDRKGAAERLDAATLAVFGIVVDVGPGLWPGSQRVRFF